MKYYGEETKQDFIDEIYEGEMDIYYKDAIYTFWLDGNGNVRRKDIVTLLTEMPKPHRKLLAFHKIYYEYQKKYGFAAANDWLRRE